MATKKNTVPTKAPPSKKVEVTQIDNSKPLPPPEPPAPVVQVDNSDHTPEPDPDNLKPNHPGKYG